ncbi:HU family DNA-binding protein [Sphaerisporangium sp. TRM90804]|uniref:HU family DNA-binding protein n=1 Tax=Sphaerisporangium sp. TRM90804 TaxID=3031113 RepID=UPI00244B071B|nr:HU family DNA-binding protein [Sphaerisporangium sp. TRM90804]MDH2424717.1 HU family DNA-binding protein [Sphaerisporangium sp. TRM90804]
MNKTQLVNAVTERVADKDAAAETVNAIIDVIQDAVASGEKVTIPGFGTFEPVHKPAREARNPSTGEPVSVAETWAPKFKPGAGFKALVHEGGRGGLIPA